MAISGVERLLTLANALGLRETGAPTDRAAREERVASRRDGARPPASEPDDGLRITVSSAANALAEGARSEERAATLETTTAPEKSYPADIATPSDGERPEAGDDARPTSARRSAAVAAYQRHRAADPGRHVRVIA